MKKNLAKRIVLGLLTGAVLMNGSVAWAYVGTGNGNSVVTGTYTGQSTADDNSVAVGINAKADGTFDIAIGANQLGTTSTTTNGMYSIAIGYDADAGTGNESGIAIGGGSNACSDMTVAIGARASSNYDYSVVLGYDASVNADNSVALGYGSIANEKNVVSVGDGGAQGGNGSDYRKIVNVENGNIAEGSHDAVTGGQLYANYYGKTEIDAKLSAVGAVDAYSKSEVDTKLADKANVATTLSGYGITNAYTKDEANNTFLTQAKADQRYVQINDNTISNNGEITFDVGDETNVVTISTTGLTVGDTSTHIDGKGVYVGAHDFTTAKSAMNDKGEIKGAGGKFEVGADGSVKAANGAFEVDANGNVTAESVTAGNLYTKEEIDQKLGGSNATVAGLNQRLEKTNAKINKVGAGAAALAALHPLDYDPDDKLTFSAGMGNYAGENAAALGAFYRPNEKFMLSLGGTMGNGENMVNLGLSIGLDKASGLAKLSKRELIQKVNAVEAENEAMKAEIIEMKAMLQELLAKK